jgi:hypothetical protein
MTIRRTEEVPGGFEGRAGGSKGNPTPTAKSTALCSQDVHWIAQDGCCTFCGKEYD